MRRLLSPFACLVTLAAIMACREPRLGAPVVMGDDAPAAGADASTPYVSVAPDGTAWMSWTEPAADSAWTIRVAHRDASGGWSPPRIVIADRLLFANWADFPSVVVDARGRLIVHLLRRSSPGKYSYHAWVTTSSDSGATWSAPQRLHGDTSATEHGFVALVPQANGTTGAAWLDGRGTQGGHTMGGVHDTTAEQGAMSLAFGVIDSTMRVRGDTLLDTRTCDCCQVAGAAVGHGAVFAYRDRSDAEVRDIAVVRYDGARWSPPAVVHADGWVTRACPVNGPAITARDSIVALAWFTNARDTAKVQLTMSGDGGATWGAPTRIDDGSPVGRVDVEYLPGRGALVTWMERTAKSRAEIRARLVTRDRRVSRAVVIAPTSDARAAGFSRTAVLNDSTALVAWRELGTPARVRTARIVVPAPR